MVGIAAILLAVAAALLGAVALGRRRAARASQGLASLDVRPAGVRHLAARVSELSDTGLHLPARSPAIHGKHRLGILLGLR